MGAGYQELRGRMPWLQTEVVNGKPFLLSYPVPHFVAAAATDLMRGSYRLMIGNGAAYFKPRTTYCRLWLTHLERRLDILLPKLRENPATHERLSSAVVVRLRRDRQPSLARLFLGTFAQVAGAGVRKLSIMKADAIGLDSSIFRQNLFEHEEIYLRWINRIFLNGGIGISRFPDVNMVAVFAQKLLDIFAYVGLAVSERRVLPVANPRLCKALDPPAYRIQPALRKAVHVGGQGDLRRRQELLDLMEGNDLRSFRLPIFQIEFGEEGGGREPVRGIDIYILPRRFAQAMNQPAVAGADVQDVQVIMFEAYIPPDEVNLSNRVQQIPGNLPSIDRENIRTEQIIVIERIEKIGRTAPP
jgi:hypothetical protein